MKYLFLLLLLPFSGSLSAQQTKTERIVPVELRTPSQDDRLYIQSNGYTIIVTKEALLKESPGDRKFVFFPSDTLRADDPNSYTPLSAYQFPELLSTCLSNGEAIIITPRQRRLDKLNVVYDMSQSLIFSNRTWFRNPVNDELIFQFQRVFTGCPAF